VADQVLIVGLENHLTLFVREDFLALSEKNVELVKKVSCRLYVDRATAAVVIPDCLL
jgi:hypothetical protein